VSASRSNIGDSGRGSPAAAILLNAQVKTIQLNGGGAPS
jgi:hypothetical protein